MKKIYILGVLVAVAFAFSSNSDTTNTVYADTPTRGSTNLVCSNSDNAIFPYGFMCGTSASNRDPISLQITGASDLSNVAAGTTLHVTASWNNVTATFGSSRKQNNNAADAGLFWVTMNTQSDTASRSIHPTAIDPVGGDASNACPGDDSVTPGGKPGPGKLWGNRDISGDYDDDSLRNGDNQSPYAYNTGTTNGVINCGSSGRMVYWKTGRPQRSETYKFDIRTDSNIDTFLNNICVRADLAIAFDNDQMWFPPHSRDDGTGRPGSPAPNTTDQSPYTKYTANFNKQITASHLVKQSEEICFNVTPPSTSSTWRPTMTATCDNLSGVISHYNSSGSVDLTKFNTRYKITVYNGTDDEDLSYDPDGTGPAGRSVWHKTGTDRKYDFPLQAPTDGDALFGNGTLRRFKIWVDENPSGGLSSTWLSFIFDAGDDLPCHPNPPAFPPGAEPRVSCTKIEGTATDPDTVNPIAVQIRDENNTEIFNQFTEADGKFAYTINSSYQDGNDHVFHVYALDDTGRSANTGPYDVTMPGCGTFLLTPNAGGNLSPNEENPSGFKADTSVQTTFPGWTSPSKPAVPAVSSNYISKNGSNVVGPAPSDSSFTEGTKPYSFSYAITSHRAGDTYCSRTTVTPAKGLIYRDPAIGGIVRIDVPSDTSNGGCPRVVNEPYVHILGSDASAGGGFGANCTTVNGGIETYTNSNGGSSITPGGSGAQLGAFSINNSSGFSSALLRNLDPTGYTGLTFSNTDNATGGTLPKPNTGGNLGGNNCVSDYFGKMPSSLAGTPSTANSISGTRVNPGGAFTQVSEYYEPAGGTLTIGSGSIDDGVNAVIYVKGNVILDGNIRYMNTNWAGIDKVPSLYIIAKGGNVYIKSTVHQIDGLIVAQPNSANNGGAIYTCASGTTGYTVSNTSLLANCNTQLVVNGAFIAQKVFLSRSFGSLRSSYPGERMNSNTQDCGLDSGNTSVGDCAAEIFNFSPEVYLAQPAMPPNTGPTTGKYDYVTSLPPVL